VTVARLRAAEKPQNSPEAATNLIDNGKNISRLGIGRESAGAVGATASPPRKLRIGASASLEYDVLATPATRLSPNCRGAPRSLNHEGACTTWQHEVFPDLMNWSGLSQLRNSGSGEIDRWRPPAALS
jgi:hypothetical protein